MGSGPRPLSLRRLVLLGFGGVFILWLFSAYALSKEMAQADARSLEIRSGFLRNEQLLSTVRTQVLLGAVILRDTRIDSPGSLAQAQAQLENMRTSVDRALADYLPRPDSTVEQDLWLNLQTELRAYWASFAPALPISAARSERSAPAAAYVRDELIPKRETVIGIS